MKKLAALILFSGILLHCFGQIPDMKENKTPTYPETIELYQQMDESSEFVKMMEYGMTDSGYPLHLVLINKDKEFDPEKFNDNKVVFLINNAIHSGEPCGVNASLHITEWMSQGNNIPENVIIGIIPGYSIGGMLNRGPNSRANQNGPEEYGFRGNGQNLDLNRDFVKADSKNALSFMEIFHDLNPDIFLDTHTSNGSDYQYTMTLITSQPEMSGPVVGPYTRNVMTPWLEKNMIKRGWPMAPYVNTVKDTPDKGIKDYPDSPRFSTGYSSAFNCLSYVSETHMLKPFPDRVRSTYELILSMCEYGNTFTSNIIENKKSADQYAINQKLFPLIWDLDTTKIVPIEFSGYEASYIPSEVTNGKRLYYNREKPWTKTIYYFNTYMATKETIKPKAYIIPQSWHKAIDRLKRSNIEMNPIKKDTTIKVTAYIIKDFKTVKNPYEGHYLHYDTELEKRTQRIDFRKGDFIIPCNQASNKFIVETLEPEGTDSYFNWNFFDIMMQQKEWFSAYVFEDKAAQMLKDDPEMKIAFDEKMKDPEFAKDAWGQLYWLYTQSEHFEPSYKRYPVFRIE